MEGINNDIQQQQLEQISLKEFCAKFSTKAEVYRFITTEVRAYMPPYQAVTIWHLKDVASSKKTVGTKVLDDSHL